MLNENKEFEQYSFNLDAPINKGNCRLKYATLTQSLSGRERAMIIVARWYIFENEPERKAFNEDDVKSFLASWCGFNDDSNNVEYKHLDKWFIRYIRNAFLKGCLEECIVEYTTKNHMKTEVYKLLKTISADDEIGVLERKCNEIEHQIGEFEKNSNLAKLNKVKECLSYVYSNSPKSPKNIFSNTMFPKEPKTDNDFKNTYYDRIIANALHSGRLEQYYLVCDIDPFKNNNIVAKARNNGTATPKLLPNDKDLLLKITAYYLLQKKNLIHGQEFVLFNKTDLINWLVASDPKLDNDNLKKYILFNTLDTLIITKSLTVDKNKKPNITKLKLHSDWVKHFKIVKSYDIDKLENRGLIIYSDLGSGFLLEAGKDKRYQL